MSKLSRKLRSSSLFISDRRVFNLILVVLTLFLSIAPWFFIIKLENWDKAVFILIIIAIIGIRWGLFGYVFLLVSISPFAWIIFNIDRIPVYGWVLTNIPREEKLIILLGGGYLLLLFFTRMRYINRTHIIPFLLLSGILVFGLLVALVFAWFPGPDSVAMQWYLDTIIVGIVVYYLISSFVNDVKRFHAIIYAVIISAILIALVTVIFPKVLIVNYIADTDPGRLGGFFTLPFGVTIWANPVYISSYMALAIVFIWGHLITENLIIWKRIFWLVNFGLLTRVLVLTNSRTGIYGAFLGIILLSGLVILRRRILPGQPVRSNHLIQWLGIGLLIVVGGAIAFWQFNDYFNNINNASFYIDRILRPLEDPNTIGRVYLFLASLKANLAYPWGIGAQAIYTITGHNEHNLYTIMLSGLGWGGFGLFICFVGWCVLKCISGIRSIEKERSFLATLVLSGITTVIFMGWGHPFVGTLWGVTLLWSLFALAASLPKLGRHSDFRTLKEPSDEFTCLSSHSHL